METPTKLDHFIVASKKGSFTMDEELGMITHLVSKYKFISKSQYAKLNNITPQGVGARLKASNNPYIIMMNKLFILR